MEITTTLHSTMYTFSLLMKSSKCFISLIDLTGCSRELHGAVVDGAACVWT